LPLVIIGAIVIPTQAVIPVQNGKSFISDFGKAKEVMVETATRTDASLFFIWIESRRYGHHKWCNGKMKLL
jgi:membrane fusion protein (multidrug efflux system)